MSEATFFLFKALMDVFTLGVVFLTLCSVFLKLITIIL